MKLLLKIVLCSFIILQGGTNVYSQIAVTGGLTAQQLAEILAGSNITVSNAVITGPAQGYGSFTNTGTFPFASGVILTNGLLSQAPGPNNDPNTSSNLGGAGTAEMNALGGANSYDVVTLEFDFVVQSASVQFQYVFASEEYPEFAPPNQPSFNDVFAFYISGPGIVGQENIALIPGTTSPVSIDNVNAVTYPQYYVDNIGGQDVQFDGYTTNLTATRTGLTPCQTYHLRMVLADIQTSNRNSAVFLKENSFVQENVLGAETQTINADGIALEGCVQGSFAFEFSEISTQDRTITFTLGGTAVNGVDYSYIDNSITIPAGETTGTVYIDAFSDGLTEGAETITITYTSGVCVGTETVTLTINDAQPINFTLDGTNLDCYGDNSGEILVNATGGFPGYTYLVTDPSGTTTSYTNNPITGLAAGEYSVQVSDTYGCKAEALVIGGQFNAGVTFLPDGSGVTYEAPLVISGFNPGQTITNVNQIQQICLTMEHSYLGDLWIRVESPSGQQVTLKQQNGGGSCDLGEPVATGPVDGQGSSDITPGVGYEYCFNANPTYGTMVNESTSFTRNYTDSQGNSYQDNYLPAGSYTASGNFSSLVGSQMNGTWKVYVTDQFGLDNGYIFNWYISLIGDLPDTTVTLTQPAEMTVSGVASNATCGSSNGSVNISALNGVAPLTYSWSNGATSEDLIAVAAGQYTVTVTDANGCTATETFIVNNIGTLALTSSITNATCFGGNNGAISIQPSGGTAPYTYSWSGGQTTQNISGLTAGSYTVTMTDQIGCVYAQALTVGEGAQILATIESSSDELCNTNNGFLDITVTGGNGSYGYLWSNGATTQDVADLTSGSYSVTITDGLGCTGTATYNIANNLTGCSNYCYLDVQSSAITNSSCGAANGAIDITVLNAVSPTTVLWSNGATTQDISSLLPGNYTVTVTGANNCSVTSTFTVGNNSGNFSIASSTVNDETCGFDNGSIDITVTGGSAPYTYLWSNGATTQDVSSLAAGNYTVTVTAQNGCQISSSYTVVNNAGSLAASAQVSSSLCNSNNGSIVQTVSGANGAVSYLWNTGATTQNLSGLAPGSYTCTVTDGSGCSLSNTYTVNQNSGNVQLTGTLVTNEVCNNNQGAINITVSGSSLTYLWSNGSTTEDLTGLNSGNYSCTITNAQGCSVSTGTITVINSPGTLVVSNQSVSNETCNNNAGTIDINVYNGTAPYTYLWSNGATTQDITGLSEGVFTLQITDNNGCSLAHSVNIINSPGTLAISAANLTHEACVAGVGTNGQGAIDITVTGGTAPYTYSWSNGATSQDLSGITDGTYQVVINSAGGCTLTQTYTILANGSNLAITSASVTDESCGSGTGAVNVTMDATSGPYSYNWSNGSITEDLSGLSEGNYTLTVNNSFGCQVVQTFSVGNSSGTLAVSGAVTDETCGNSNGAIDVSVTGGNQPYSYNWSNAATTQDLSAIPAGTYTATVTDNYGCSAQYTSVVTNNAGGLSATIAGVTNETCGQNNGAINATVSGAGPFTYLWSNGATTEDISGLSAGTYTLTVTDASTCSFSVTSTVSNQTGSLGISFSNVQNEACGNGQGFIDIQVTGTGPFTYLWSNSASTQDITGLSSGDYTVTVTDGTGCQLDQTFTIGNTNTSQVSATLDVSDAYCSSANGAIDLTVTAGITPFSFSWSNSETTEDISGLAAGNYTVTITDGANCQTTYTANVSVFTSDLAIIGVTVYNDFCNGQQGGFDVTAQGQIQEYYLDGTPVGSNFIFGLSEGTYLIEVTDIYGCSVSTTETILNDAFFDLSETHVNTTCGSSNGSINLTVQGGGPGGNYTYQWSNGATTQDLTNIPAGTYTVTVTAPGGPGGGCSDQLTIIVTNDNGFEVSAVITDDYCGQATGAIDQTITNGSSMTYLWSTGATTEDLSAFSFGDYTCTVTEAGGCSVDFSYTIGNQTNGTVASVTSVNEVCGDGTGAIDLTLTGGSGNFDILWSNSQTTEDLSGLSAGNYTATIIDLNDGCIIGASVLINNNVTLFDGYGIVTNAPCATCATGSVNIVLDWSTTYTYQWSNGATTQDIYGVVPGTYSVLVTSAEGCDTTMTFTVQNTAGIEEIENTAIGLMVYPNPARDQFSVDCVLPEGKEASMLITDVAGKVIFEQHFTGSKLVDLKAEKLQEGIYFVSLRSGASSKTERLVIIAQ